MPPLLNIKSFIRLDAKENLVLPNELYVNCLGYVKTPLSTDDSNKIATTEWVRDYVSGGTGTGGGGISSETDPIFSGQIGMYYNKIQSDARYLQSFTETDPVWTSEKANYALKTYVDTSISNLVNSAPTTLNTLKELADALGSDPNFATSITTLISTKANDSLVVKLAGTQTITGSKTFSSVINGDAGISLKEGVVPSGLGYTALAGDPDGLLIVKKVGTTAYTNLLYFNSATSNTYTFPNASGTIALTSNIPSLSGYVPYSGATSALNMGNNAITTNTSFNGRFLYLDAGVEEVGGSIVFRQRTSISGAGADYTTLGAVSTNTLSFSFWQDAPGGVNRYKFFQFKTDNLTISTNRIYQMPDASGTLALTSNLSSYVPYTGATTNVNLGANELTASNIVTENSFSTKILASGTAFRNGYTTLSSLAGNLSFTQAVSAGNLKSMTFNFSAWSTNTSYTYTLPALNGTFALTSDLSVYELLSNKSNNASLGTSDTLYPTQAAVKSYVDSVVTGGMNIQGDWNANTNTPNISGTTTTGFTWRVSTAGTTNLGGIAVWNVNDLAVKTATGWIKIDNSSSVVSVFGRQGVVVANVGDYNTSQVTESGNLYYTDARARAAISLTTTGTSGNASYSAGVLNIPNYTYTLPTASTTVLGGVKVDGTTITINGSGVISGANTYTLPTATDSILGGVKIGSGISILLGVISVSTNYQAPLSGSGIVKSTSGTITYLTDNTANWDTAYADRNKWDGGSTGLVASTGRTSLGLGTAATANSSDFAAAVHTHTIANITSLQTTLDGKEPSITAGTTAQYWRGDKTWQTLPSYSLPIASATVLGGIKVGTNLSIDSNGVLSSSYTDTNTTYSLSIPAATTKLRLTGSDASTSDITFTAGANVTITRTSASEFTIASSYTDTNTTYVNFTRTVAGLVPSPGGSSTNRYLREDGTWVVPPDTDTDTNTVTQIRREDADGSTGATTYRTGDIRLRQGSNVTITEVTAGIFQISSSYTDTNTWNANSKDVAGYVSAPGAVANKVWKTDASGNPGWRDDADTDTNTTYTAGAGLTLSGTTFSVTKTISASQDADTIALRNGSGELVATGFYQASSRALKTNINPFTKSALDIIREVTVVSFNYKTDVINKHIGFIAEDTPEELSTRNKNVMDSNNTIGVLLKAVQELEARIKILESK